MTSSLELRVVLPLTFELPKSSWKLRSDSLPGPESAAAAETARRAVSAAPSRFGGAFWLDETSVRPYTRVSVRAPLSSDHPGGPRAFERRASRSRVCVAKAPERSGEVRSDAGKLPGVARPAPHVAVVPVDASRERRAASGEGGGARALVPVTAEGVSRAWRLRAAAAAAPALSATASLPPTELERLAFAVCGEIGFRARARDVSGRRRAVTPDMSGLRPSFGAFGSVTRFVQLEPSYRVSARRLL